MDINMVEQLRKTMDIRLDRLYASTSTRASAAQLYHCLAGVLRDSLAEKHRHHMAHAHAEGAKQVHYLSIEFLVGRSLKNTLFGLGIEKEATEVISESGCTLEDLYNEEPDAGLGNGGLGRLAACYLDALATMDYPAYGYSILYEFGIFKQKIIDGWQQEEMDNWLPQGGVWMISRHDERVDIRFGGEVEEIWENNHLFLKHTGYETVAAYPYDMYIPGYNSKGVSKLRLFKADSPGLDMESFNRGDYESKTKRDSVAELISKVLYPNDNHLEGKILRLRQQYFLCAASLGDIVRKHLSQYGTMDNFSEKNAIHINDTHPTLAIPELIRILIDECGYSWEGAMQVAARTFSYTNHTVMTEALEQWSGDILKTVLPRIFQIITEMDRKLVGNLQSRYGDDWGKINYMRLIDHGHAKMANLCISTCHSVNGVSRIHSEILKTETFRDYYDYSPWKFKNVTNGIAYRRWLLQSNPDLTNLLESLIGPGFKKNADELQKLEVFQNDAGVLRAFREVKLKNKERLAKYVNKTAAYPISADSIFDVQAKRMHEYKRQHLNALQILYRYLEIKKGATFLPRTYIFGAKAAPGYYMAKQMIRFICGFSEYLESDPDVRDMIRIVFLEDYRVTLSEILMPAAEISEQISLAGTEASGTGNMKLMMGGAVTLGTLDGANVEIREAVGDENFVLFGMTEEEVKIARFGYDPYSYYQNDDIIRETLDFIEKGFGGNTYPEIANLKRNDPYLVLADFSSYIDAQRKVDALYSDIDGWNRMSMMNTAHSGRFSADRAVAEYARSIWTATPLE